jgi:hypothetical protein
MGQSLQGQQGVATMNRGMAMIDLTKHGITWWFMCVGCG